MKAELKAFVDSFLSGQAQLVRPKNSWAAIATGAALAGLDKSPIVLRKAQRHVGILVHMEFDETKHDETDLVDCPLEGPRAKDQVEWVLERVSNTATKSNGADIKQGEDVEPGKKRTIRAYAAVKTPANIMDEVIIGQGLYGCSDPNAPMKMGSNGI